MGTQLVEIKLQDVNTGLIYTTYVSSDEADKVETDIVYASKVLESLKQKRNKGNVVSSTSMTSTTSTADVATEQYNEQDSTFKWSHRAILLLIEEYRKREEDITSGKVSQKRMWELISKTLCSHGHDVTGPQCQSKFNGMKKTFKSIKDHNSKSGNAARAWPYTEIMESLMGEKPFMKPVALASSSGTETDNEYSDISLAGSSNTARNSNSSRERKRKVCNVAEAILESRRISEENKCKRHKQTTEQRAKLLEVLDKLVDKLQVNVQVMDECRKEVPYHPYPTIFCIR